MNYLLIEEKAWDELLAHARNTAEQMKRLERHFNPADTDGWIDTQDVCQWLNITKRTLQYYRDNGTIPYSTIGKKCYYKVTDIKAVLDNGLINKKR